MQRLNELADALIPGETSTAVPPPAAETISPPPPPPPPPPVVEDVSREPAYDAEIASIFTEESAELLEAADRALSDWLQSRTPHPMGELKRHLHTLKGGARMAGISAMGNLSHELETLLISVDDGRVESTEIVEDLLQGSIDELHRMRDTVITGKPVRPAAKLIQHIQQAIAGVGPLDAAALAPAGEDVEPKDLAAREFTVEPDEAVSMVFVDAPSGDRQDRRGRVGGGAATAG